MAMMDYYDDVENNEMRIKCSVVDLANQARNCRSTRICSPVLIGAVWRTWARPPLSQSYSQSLGNDDSEPKKPGY